MTRIFIDGSAGTTGLRIHERLRERDDLSLIILPEEQRKDPVYIEKAFKEADLAFLCLPDAAAIEAAGMAADTGCRIIDASTAHRVSEGWVYGFPELEGAREKIKYAPFVANPGCHASGFIALIAPLIKHGLISGDTGFTCISLTGYSGGGKKMIAQYEDSGRSMLLDAPRVYGITQNHKHLKEMISVCGLGKAPAFYPIVSDYYAGMLTSVPVFAGDLYGTIDDIRRLYSELYKGPVVKYMEAVDDAGFISGCALSGRDDMIVSVTGSAERITLIAVFDNLGKGASGAAIQNMNIMLGTEETAGLKVG